MHLKTNTRTKTPPLQSSSFATQRWPCSYIPCEVRFALSHFSRALATFTAAASAWTRLWQLPTKAFPTACIRQRKRCQARKCERLRMHLRWHGAVQLGLFGRTEAKRRMRLQCAVMCACLCAPQCAWCSLCERHNNLINDLPGVLAARALHTKWVRLLIFYVTSNALCNGKAAHLLNILLSFSL